MMCKAIRVCATVCGRRQQAHHAPCHAAGVLWHCVWMALTLSTCGWEAHDISACLAVDALKAWPDASCKHGASGIIGIRGPPGERRRLGEARINHPLPMVEPTGATEVGGARVASVLLLAGGCLLCEGCSGLTVQQAMSASCSSSRSGGAGLDADALGCRHLRPKHPWCGGH